MNLSFQFEVHKEGRNLVLSKAEFGSKLSALRDDFEVGEQEILSMVSGSLFDRYFVILDGPTTRTEHLVRLVFLEDNFRSDFASSTGKILFAHS